MSFDVTNDERKSNFFPVSIYNSVEAIEYIHISLSIFHEKCYWGIPSQYDENGVAHYPAATKFFSSSKINFF